MGFRNYYKKKREEATPKECRRCRAATASLEESIAVLNNGGSHEKHVVPYALCGITSHSLVKRTVQLDIHWYLFVK